MIQWGALNYFPCSQKNFLTKSYGIKFGNLRVLLFTVQISSDFLKGEFSYQICDMGDYFEYKTDGIGILGKYRDEE